MRACWSSPSACASAAATAESPSRGAPRGWAATRALERRLDRPERAAGIPRGITPIDVGGRRFESAVLVRGPGDPLIQVPRRRLVLKKRKIERRRAGIPGADDTGCDTATAVCGLWEIAGPEQSSGAVQDRRVGNRRPEDAGTTSPITETSRTSTQASVAIPATASHPGPDRAHPAAPPFVSRWTLPPGPRVPRRANTPRFTQARPVPGS